MGESESQPKSEQLYQWWWLHDARWYQEVAQRFGFDAANEINKSALRFVGARVARGVLKELDKPIEQMEWREVVEVFCRAARLMWPGLALDFTCEVTGPGKFEVNIVRNFALDMLQRAGTLDKYDCPCLELREGWFEGFGLHPVENRIQQCIRNGGSACTLIGCVARFSSESDHGTDSTG